MTNKRDDFSEATKRLLAHRVGGRRSNPDCRKPTFGANTDPNKITNIGVASHICAAAKGGPRYDYTMTPRERKDPQNGIWLCQSCSKLIDSDASYYTAERLYNWKRLAEQTSLLNLEKPSDIDPVCVNNSPSNEDIVTETWFANYSDAVQVRWGYPSIDRQCKLTPGSIILVAGYTDSDVSSYIQNVVRHNVKGNAKFIYFNLKESSTSVVNKLLSAESHVRTESIRTGTLTEEEWSQIGVATEILKKSSLLLEKYDLKHSMSQRVLQAVQNSNADAIIVDDIAGLGLDTDALNTFMYRLCSSAAESKVVVFLVLTVAEKPTRADKRPMLSDLKVNELCKFCDVVQFLFWDEFDNYASDVMSTKLEIITAKNYSGAVPFTVRLMKLVQCSSIEEYQENEDTAFAKKYPGAVAGVELFAKYLENL